MRDLSQLDAYRLTTPEVFERYGGFGDETCGVFELQGPCGAKLRVIASSGAGWDHVSVSIERRIPNWTEMDWVKRRFFRDGETAMQLHVPAAEHVNVHPNCLHLWRPHDVPIPLPPTVFV